MRRTLGCGGECGGEPGALPRAHPKPGGRTVSEAQGGGRRAPQAGDGGRAVAEREAEAERAQGGGEGGEEDPAAAGNAVGTRRGVSGAAGREGEAAEPRGPHLASGGRKSGRVSSESSGDMLVAAESGTRELSRPRRAPPRRQAWPMGRWTRPQSELTNGSTEPVAKLAAATQVQVGGVCVIVGTIIQLE